MLQIKNLHASIGRWKNDKYKLVGKILDFEYGK